MGKLPFMKFYPGDFDRDMAPYPVEIRGAWISIINHLWYQENRGRATHSFEEWGRIIGADDAASNRIISRIIDAKIADCGSACNGVVTLICRRMEREEKQRENTKMRVDRFRSKQDCNADVTPCNDDVTPKKLEVRSQKSEKTKTLPSSFLEFWNCYPRKIGKKSALRSWNNAKDKPAIEIILKSIENQKKSDQWTKDGGQFIPHPATWINQGRWMDEIKSKEESWREKVKLELGIK